MEAKQIPQKVFEDSEIAIYQNMNRYFCLFRLNFVDSENSDIQNLSQKVLTLIEETQNLKLRFIYSEMKALDLKKNRLESLWEVF